jgi:hypothetical protein
MLAYNLKRVMIILDASNLMKAIRLTKTATETALDAPGRVWIPASH